ncbi:tRNA pseudouridine(38-40) synthase TruA [Flavitalea flava]
MPRYFLEVAYKGTNYSGFQIQENAGSIQEQVEKALATFFRVKITLTGSSRTDTGVHAHQNFFHFDFEGEIAARSRYNVNAILPGDIVLKGFYRVDPSAHCRFDAMSREYRYYIYREKDPFVDDRAYYFPYTLDKDKLDAAAALILRYTDFTAFSKRNTQVKSYLCTIGHSAWSIENGTLVYAVKANRFLRGMVRGLVGTMLQVGRGKLTVEQFEEVLQSKDNRRADFSAPGHGLFLFRVNYLVSIFKPGD